MNRGDVSTNSTLRQQIGPLGMILAASVMIAGVPIFAKLAYASGASVFFVVLGRAAISTVLLGCALLTLRQSFCLTNRAFRLCVIGGIAGALTSLGLLGSVASIDVSLAMLIVYLHPMIIAFIGRMRGTYQFGPTRIVFCIMILCGLGLALSVKLTGLAPEGIALACLGAFSLSIMLVVNGDAVSEARPIVVSFYTTLTSFIAVGSAGAFIGTVAVPETPSGWLGFFGAGSSYCVGLALFVAAVRVIDVARASLIGLVEPLIAIFLAMALFGEQLSWLQWLGVGIVLLGLALLELPPAFVSKMLGREAKQPSPPQ